MTSRWSPHPRYRLYTTSASCLPPLNPSSDAIREFEAEICRRFKVAAAVCVPMARTGLYFTLLETVRPGQRVIMSPLTIIDVVNAVLLAGAVPVFADICRESCSISPGSAEALIDKNTAAVMITHLHGETAGAHAFRDICSRHGVRLIEDAAQAFGAIEQTKRLGTIGDAGIYSFGFFKHLSTWRGGMVVSNDQELIARIRGRIQKLSQVSRFELLLRVLSASFVNIGTWPPIFSKLVYPVVSRNVNSFNRRLDPEAGVSRLEKMPKNYLGRMRQYQGLLGLKQLERVDRDSHARIAHAAEYHDGLDGVPGVMTPRRAADLSNIYTYFPIQVKSRSALLDYARRRSRDFAAQHLRNCADLDEFREFYTDCPNARAAASELILLPTYPRYARTEVKLNIEVVREFTADHRLG